MKQIKSRDTRTISFGGESAVKTWGFPRAWAIIRRATAGTGLARCVSLCSSELSGESDALSEKIRSRAAWYAASRSSKDTAGDCTEGCLVWSPINQIEILQH